MVQLVFAALSEQLAFATCFCGS